MYKPDLRLEAVTSAERTGAVTAMDEAIGAAGGWIQDCNFFSNISVAIRCGVPTQNLAGLLARFRSAGLKFAAVPFSIHRADDTSDAKEMTVSVNVTFAHHELD